MWNRIGDDAALRGVDSLSDLERAVYYVNRFLFEFESGGLDGFLYNSAPDSSRAVEWDQLRQAVVSVRFFGRGEVADLLDEARSIVEGHVPKPGRWETYLAEADSAGRLQSPNEELRGRYELLWSDIEEAARKIGH